MNIEKFPVQVKYKKQNGLWVVDLEKLALPKGFNPVEKNLLFMPPQQFGGNHKHPREEVFLGINENLQIIWLDEMGQRHEEIMNPKGELFIFYVPANTPHVVRNNSKTLFGILYELASDHQHDVERVNII